MREVYDFRRFTFKRAFHLQRVLRWNASRLAYHHHFMMVAETFEEISDIIGEAGPETGLLLDTGHAAAAGFDYAKLIERFGDRIVHIHLKDVRKAIRAEVQSKDLPSVDEKT
ncbi:MULTISPECIES: TIM barrel protein [Agrobacterium]|uniref:TIM barrel protein n=1 Tax=Agrobacterium TaxID=357 RepID=UPI001FCD7DD2|nr:TIM barrel protein [Agrobacterium sp. NCPPB 925]